MADAVKKAQSRNISRTTNGGVPTSRRGLSMFQHHSQTHVSPPYFGSSARDRLWTTGKQETLLMAIIVKFFWRLKNPDFYLERILFCDILFRVVQALCASPSAGKNLYYSDTRKTPPFFPLEAFPASQRSTVHPALISQSTTAKHTSVSDVGKLEGPSLKLNVSSGWSKQNPILILKEIIERSKGKLSYSI